MVDFKRAWDKFSLLFWKNWLLQRRHRQQTVIEILVPVIFCALLVVIRSLVVAETIDKNTIYDPFSPDNIPDINVSFPYNCDDVTLFNCNNVSIPETTTTLPSTDAVPTERVDMIEGTDGRWQELIKDKIDPGIICKFLFDMSNSLSKNESERESGSKDFYKMAQERFDRIKGKYNKETAERYKSFGNQLDILYRLFPDMFAFYKSGFITLKRWLLLWSPDTPEINLIMKDVSKDLPVIGCPVADAKTLEEKITTPLLVGTPEAIILAGVVFSDSVGKETLPNKLNISIRFPGESRNQTSSDSDGADGSQNSGVRPKTWNTGYVFPLYQVAGPRNREDTFGGSPGYYNEGFLGIQNGIFARLLKYQADKKNLILPEFNITLKRFPYPKFIDDKLLPALESFVPVIIMLSFLYTAVSTVRTVTTEKEKQLKEAMKMMGLPNWLHWTAWFVQNLIMFFVSVVLIVILLKAPLVGNDLLVLPYSDWSCLLAFLFVYIIASITFCFAISVFFSKASTAAVVSGMIWFICYLPYFFLQERYSSTGLGTKLTASLLSNTAMAYGFQIMLMYEGTGAGLQWSNLWTPVTPDDTLTMGHVMGFLLIDSAIYMCLTVYIEAIFPGEYGVPLPWNFPFKKSYWFGEKAHNYVEDNEELPSYKNSDIYEKEPRNLPAGVQIKRLKKVYNNNKVAVNDLTLNMYEGQITVLLGHNGAGKTTTMSMLTGLFTPTSGTALVGGHDIRTDIQGVRETLGLCPQHNVLFEELTVKEHLRFFGKLKGLNAIEMKEETDKYLELLNLEDKGDTQAKKLSGGMQRKLSAAVALCGKSKVVLFDEPTSGMDPSARRSLWDLLQGEKEGKTILLTTHFMDEADLLGDRIAIMSEGKLQCCGSSFFLKKKYGGGYYLVMVKNNQCEPEKVTEFLKSYIPDIVINSNIGSELSYCLEEKYSYKFEDMFNEIEGKRDELGILSYGVSLTTMEEVFMRVGSESEVKKQEPGLEETTLILPDDNGFNSHKQNGVALTINQSPLLKGGKLVWNQIIAMFTKYITAWYRSWLLYLIIILIPVIDLTISILVAKSLQGTNDLPPRVLKLQDFSEATVTVMDTPNCINNHFCKNLAQTYRNILSKEKVTLKDPGSGNDVDSYLIKEMEHDVGTVSQTYILGTSFHQHNASSPINITGWFNNQPYHIPPVALSYIYNAIFQYFIDDTSMYTFTNHPLPFTEETKVLIQQTGGNVGFQIAFNIGFSFSFVSSYFLIFYIRERIGKAKLLQFVSGVNVFTFWITGYIWNFISILGPVLAIVITLAAFQEDGFSTFEELGRCFLLMICCAFATLPLMYLASFLFVIPAIGFARMIFFNVFTGLATFIIVMVLQTPSLDLVDVANTLDWVFTFLPSYSLTYSFANLNKAVIFLNMCEPIYEKYCKVRPDFKSVCCKNETQCPPSGCVSWTDNYFDWEAPGIGRNLAFFFVDGAILFAILLIIEHRLWEMITYRRQGVAKPENVSSEEQDSDVLAENDLVQHITADKRGNYNLLLQGVTKYYGKFLAVRNLNLAVEKGECFGLLGVNGAGKTSTFKMLTGDEKISFGDAYVNGLSLKYQMKKVNQLIGYCPQFDALIDDLTGREILRLFCLLRGVPRYEIQFVSEKLAKELLFFKHIDKKVKEYSGGNKRKLSTAVALIGDPPVVYLDEPTTGMDPVAKRHLWDVICKVRSAGKTIILTSHSMEECEALCTRLAIMVNGEFKCLGSTQHLKTKFAQGYTLIIKVRKRYISSPSAPLEPRESDTSQIYTHRRQRSSISVRRLNRQDSVYSHTELEPIKNYIQDHFEGAILKEEYQGLLTYQLPPTHMTWAKMFGVMESAKKQLDIEDYSLGQTSLEQVFLSFTKYQQNRNTEE